jgi:DNA-binding response OmpR family regulator
MKILLVEDHDDTRSVLTRLLDRLGYCVMSAATVADARRLLRELQFDVLLSDIGLPDGNGFGLVVEAKQLQPLKAVALTAWASDDDKERGRTAGFDHYLTKPLDCARLQAVLAAA